MERYFHADISGWTGWAKVYQDRDAFGPLAMSILEKEGLPRQPLLPCTPGTHYVARTGELVLKIYAPRESGDAGVDFINESFGLRHAYKHGVRVPAPIASGVVADKYQFEYLITQYISGRPFALAKKRMTPGEKQAFSRGLRDMSGLMNVALPDFNGIDTLAAARTCRRWGTWKDGFNRERLAFYDTFQMPEQIFVHGDLNEDNILIKDGVSYLIDFGDCRRAPLLYEQAVVALELFRLDSDFMRGYFGDTDREKLLSVCFEGALLHEYGGEILKQRFALSGCSSLGELKERLSAMIF